jgi:DNA-binding transcriptional LysR family regulator
MNKPQTIDWNRIRAFLATVEEGSLSAAARSLGLTQPTLSRQVSALEEELGIMLFERIGRGLMLTSAGIELLEHTRAMGEAARRVSFAAEGQMQALEGLVRITASDVFSAYVLPPFLHRLRRRAPRLEIDIVAANDIRDLMRREADIAIRHVRPEQPDLIARLVGEKKAHFYASTEYLNQRGRPKALADLAQHDFISFGDTDEMLKHYLPLGLPLGPENFPIGSKSGLVAWEFARQGFGITAMSDDVAQALPGMENVLPAMDPVSFPVWLVTHRELHTSRRIRLVFDMLADFLSQNP